MGVAAYRFACEAMTNVVRHAAARSCTVRLHTDCAELNVDVEDDGVGFRGDAERGVGRASMRIRAESLGGPLERGPGRGGAGARQRGLAAGGRLMPEIRVLVADDHPTFRSGVRAVLATARPEDIVAGVRAAAAGHALFTAEVASRMAAFFGSPAAGRALPFPELSEREKEVLELLARGEGNADIARQLHLSSKTVRNYVSQIVAKLCADDRAEVIGKARDAGFGRRPR